MEKMKKLVLIFLVLGTAIISAQTDEPTGSLEGKVIDRETKSPLIGVNIYVKNTQTGTTTDIEGNYGINSLPVGMTTVVFSYIGYEKVTKTDINIKPDGTSFVNVEMKSSAVELQDVVVTDLLLPMDISLN